MKRNLFLMLFVLVGMSVTRAQSYNEAFFEAFNSNRHHKQPNDRHFVVRAA